MNPIIVPAVVAPIANILAVDVPSNNILPVEALGSAPTVGYGTDSDNGRRACHPAWALGE